MNIIDRYKWVSCCVWLLATLVSSCYEDKGNYDYNWIPNVSLHDKLADTFVERGTVFRLAPQLSQIVDGDTAAIDPENYSFKWMAVLNKDEKTLISTRQHLDDTIWLATGKNYQVNYIVTEKASGVEWLHRFQLRIVQRLTDGYLLMTEDANKQVELEIYASDSKGQKVHETGVLGRSGFPYTGGGANCVSNIYFNKTKSYLWVATGEGTAYLKLPDFSWEEKQMIGMLMSKRPDDGYSFKTIYQYNNEGSFYLTDQGNAHVLTGNGIVFADYAYANKIKFRASPYTGGSSRSVIMFDEDRGCFLLYAQGSSGLVAPVAMCKDVDEGAACMGSKLYYMQLMSGSSTVAIYKDAQGKYMKGVFKIGGSSGNWKLLKDDLTAEFKGDLSLIERADSKVISWNYGKLYFTADGKLYTYRDEGVEACKEVNLLDKEGNRISPDEVVAVMMINNGMTGGDYRKYIYVSTYSPENGGKVYVTIPEQTECRNLRIQEVIRVNGRVKSICNWKN